ncbi:MAG TPA: DUF2510 domain-containing protein [Acidimicrobiales bacterium]|nr:DUF2510 domain-containing protein [Acidimicrobiales bacterium]
MFGGGIGSRGGYGNPTLRNIRIGLVVAVIAAGLLFHRSGSAYSAIRTVYLVAVLGFLAYGFTRRRRSGIGGARRPGSLPGGAPLPGGWGGQQGAPVDIRPAPSDPAPPLAAAGWFPEPDDPGVERYWDGANWSKRRHRQGDSWVED